MVQLLAWTASSSALCSLKHPPACTSLNHALAFSLCAHAEVLSLLSSPEAPAGPARSRLRLRPAAASQPARAAPGPSVPQAVGHSYARRARGSAQQQGGAPARQAVHVDDEDWLGEEWLDYELLALAQQPASSEGGVHMGSVSPMSPASPAATAAATAAGGAAQQRDTQLMDELMQRLGQLGSPQPATLAAVPVPGRQAVRGEVQEEPQWHDRRWQVQPAPHSGGAAGALVQQEQRPPGGLAATAASEPAASVQGGLSEEGEQLDGPEALSLPLSPEPLWMRLRGAAAAAQAPTGAARSQAGQDNIMLVAGAAPRIATAGAGPSTAAAAAVLPRHPAAPSAAVRDGGGPSLTGISDDDDDFEVSQPAGRRGLTAAGAIASAALSGTQTRLAPGLSRRTAPSRQVRSSTRSG